MKKFKPVNDKVFNYIRSPQGMDNKSSSYLGGGYWRGIDYSQNSALQNVNTFQVGHGSQSIKMDRSGLSIGGQSFEEARQRTDTLGNTIYNDGKKDRILIGEFSV